MNEYFIEDEYSFYEIDPECRIEYRKEEPKIECFRKLAAEEYEELTADGCMGISEKFAMQPNRSSRFHTQGCSCLLWCLLFLKYGLG